MSSSSPSGSADELTLGAPESSATNRREGAILQRGDEVGRYLVLDKIGHGGMGVVYAAYDPELDRRVALKLLMRAPERGSGESERDARLLREAQAMAKLTDAHVVTVYDAGTIDGSVFIAMEFVEGGTLGARMAAHEPWPQLLPLFLQAGKGLGAAHAAGLVHRDFKPDNVLLARGPAGDLVAKVSDFGLARAIIEDSGSAHQHGGLGDLVGTPAYMAPEQHLGAVIDARADQFAFCVALYEALYGARPFQGASLSELAWSVTSGSLAAVPADAAVPAWLRRVVLRGLATAPEDRWPSMHALLEALRADPSRKRRRRLIAAITGAGVLATIGTLALVERHERAACRAEGAVVDALWNDTRAERIAASMRATGVHYAEPTILRIGALLAPWTQQWSTTREQVCIARTQGRDEELLALQSSCLDERLTHLEVALELFDDADADAVARGVQIVAGLPRIEPCTDPAWVRAHVHPGSQDDPEAATTRARELARLDALVRNHRDAPAGELAQRLLALTIDEPLQHAEVQLQLGQIGLRADAIEQSSKHLRAAYLLAGAHHDDRIAARAGIQLVMLLGVHNGDLAAGKSWAEHATMMVARDPDPELRLELLYAVGAISTLGGEYDAAIAGFLEEVALAAALYGADHNETGYAQLALGNALSSAGRLDDARAAYLEARRIWEQALGDEHPLVAAAIYSLANLEHRHGRYPESLALHREALALRLRVLGEADAELAASYSAVGSLRSQIATGTGLDDHRHAVAILQLRYPADSPTVLSEQANVVEDLIARGEVDEAEQAIESRCHEGARLREVRLEAWIRCIDQRGHILALRGRNTEAAAMFEEAVALGEQLFGSRDMETRTRRIEWGRLLLRSGQPERARAALEPAIASLRAEGSTAHPETRTALLWLGRSCIAAGDREAAVRALEQARALAPTDAVAELASLDAALAEARR
jgi:eukaryotic-like serine/threonine-protein kinase